MGQQRFVIKFFWLREYRRRQKHQELLAILGSDAYSEDLMKCWVARFQSGDISCAWQTFYRFCRDLSPIPTKSSFASARVLSWHFSICATTSKKILIRVLGLKKLTLRWVPHKLWFKSHHGGKIQEKFDRKGLVRCPHPSYSPNLNPFDFRFSGMAKEKMKDCEFRTVQDILGRLRESWNDRYFHTKTSVISEYNQSPSIYRPLCSQFRPELIFSHKDFSHFRVQSIAEYLPTVVLSIPSGIELSRTSNLCSARSRSA
jgi:hypothetical protein